MLQTFIEYFLLHYMNIEHVMYTHAHISEKKKLKNIFMTVLS